MSAEVTVSDDPAGSCYEARLGDGVAGVAYYRLDGDTIVFTHTEVQLEGQGIGSALVRSALDDCRARGLTVVARCPFVASYIERHPAYADLL